MQCLAWQVGEQSIPFFLGQNATEVLAAEVRDLEPDMIVVIADEIALKLHGSSLVQALQRVTRTEVLAFPARESRKSLLLVQELAERVIVHGATRRSLIVGFGGGTTGNVAGLLAALLFRGVRLIHVPTTFLAMHDSVTSLKQGVNCAGAKNILGVFHRPVAIFGDVNYLLTLPPRQLKSGLVELVKNALIFGDPYAERLSSVLHAGWHEKPEALESLVRMGVEAKLTLLKGDAREKGPAIVFEYGHTAGHALELASDGLLNHGEAVAHGLRCAAWVSYALGHMTRPGLRRHRQIMSLCGALRFPTAPTIERALNLIRYDNKRGLDELDDAQAVPMVLLREPGVVVTTATGSRLSLVNLGPIEEALLRLQRISCGATMCSSRERGRS
jgi:3-dehydroquinate synthase/2-deoxy-scyllo-inosose synthase